MVYLANIPFVVIILDALVYGTERLRPVFFISESYARVGRFFFVSCSTSLNANKCPMISASAQALGVVLLLIMCLRGGITVYGICDVVGCASSLSAHGHDFPSDAETNQHLMMPAKVDY